MPNVPHAFVAKTAHDVVCILVKTARHHTSVPRQHRTLPHPPAGVVQGVAEPPLSRHGIAVVTSMLRLDGQQRVPIVRVVELGGLDDHLVHSLGPCFLQHLRDLVFIGPYHQKLPDQVGSFSSFAFGLHHGAGAFEHLLQLTSNPVGGVGRLGQAIDGDDQSAQTCFDQRVAAGGSQMVRVGGRRAVKTVGLASFQKAFQFGMEQGLPLEVQIHIREPRPHFLHPIFGGIHLKHARGPRKRPQPTGAFRAAQVARCRGFDGEAGRHGAGMHDRGARALGLLEARPKTPRVLGTLGSQHPQPFPSIFSCGPTSHVRKVRSRYLRGDDPHWGNALERRLV